MLGFHIDEIHVPEPGNINIGGSFGNVTTARTIRGTGTLRTLYKLRPNTAVGVLFSALTMEVPKEGNL